MGALWLMWEEQTMKGTVRSCVIREKAGAPAQAENDRGWTLWSPEDLQRSGAKLGPPQKMGEEAWLDTYDAEERLKRNCFHYSK